MNPVPEAFQSHKQKKTCGISSGSQGGLRVIEGSQGGLRVIEGSQGGLRAQLWISRWPEGSFMFIKIKVKQAAGMQS